MIIVMGVGVVKQIEISRQNWLDFRDRTNRRGGIYLLRLEKTRRGRGWGNKFLVDVENTC